MILYSDAVIYGSLDEEMNLVAEKYPKLWVLYEDKKVGAYRIAKNPQILVPTEKIDVMVAELVKNGHQVAVCREPVT